MSSTMSPSAATLIAARAFSRRGLLKSALFAGTALSAAPLIGGKAFGQSSGEVNVYAWGEYISEGMVEAFKQDTGIQINLSVYGTNNEVLTKLTASEGQGFDLVFPSVTYLPAWYDAGDLLQPVDESRVDVDNIITTLWEKSLELGATRRGKRYAVPFNWGTEAIAFDSTQRDYSYGSLSWDTQWEEENKGLVTTRPRSGLATMAIMLDGTGEKFIEAHGDEVVARQVFDDALKIAIERKAWIRQFWKDAQALTDAYMENGCVVGQSWDGTAIRMWQDTDGKIKYLAPVEGALTWLDTMAIPSGARNIDQTYALINWLLSAKGGGMYTVHSGYNSAAIGAENALDAGARDRFDFMYCNGDAIGNLFWWPPEAGWFQELRAPYIEHYEAA